MNKIDVIIPIYNCGIYVERAIQSVPSDVGIILVDDCSDEDYSNLTEKYSNITLLHTEKNLGAGAARNVGMNHSSADWVIFLDADDELTPLLFSVLRKEIDSSVNYIESRINHYRMCDSPILWQPDLDLFHGKAYRLSALRENGIRWHPKLRYYEDVYFHLFVTTVLGHSCITLDEIGYIQYENRESTTGRLGKEYRCSWLQETIAEKMDLKLACLMDDVQNDETIESILKIWPLERITVEDNLIRAKNRINTVEQYCDFTRTITPEYDISFIIPLYKSKSFIQDTLNSLYSVMTAFKGTFEVICTAEPDDVDYDYLLEYPNLTLINNGRRAYMGKNRNRALRLAKGEWVYFLDHDDRILEDGIYELNNLIRDKNICMIQFKELNGRVESDDVITILDNPYVSDYCIHGKFFRLNFLRENNVLFHENLITGEDTYFCHRVKHIMNFRFINGIVYVDIPVSVWVEHDESMFHKVPNYPGEHFLEGWYGNLYATEFEGLIVRAFFVEELKQFYDASLILLAQWDQQNIFVNDNLDLMEAMYNYAKYSGIPIGFIPEFKDTWWYKEIVGREFKSKEHYERLLFGNLYGMEFI